MSSAAGAPIGEDARAPGEARAGSEGVRMTNPHAADRTRLRGTLAGAMLLAAAVLGGAAGCRNAPINPLREIEAEGAARITEEELSERLDRFAEMYAQTIAEGVRALSALDGDPAVRREALVWQIQSIRTCRNSVLAPDPQVAFIDVWVLCVQQREFFATQSFSQRFGDRAKPLIDAARNLESEIAAIGAGFLRPAELARARESVEAFARQFPIRDGFARAAPLPSTAGTTATQQLTWLTTIPMAPFRFVTGIDEGAAAVRHFASVADRFSRRIDVLPQETLWEVQLLLHDLEQQSAVQRTVASVESAARTGESVAATAREFQTTAANLAETVRALPADVRKEADTLLAAIDARQTELRATIAEVRKAVADTRELTDRAGAVVADAKAAGAGFDATAKSTADAARALEGAIGAYRTMMLEVHPPKPAGSRATDPADPAAKRFDVMEWKQTADSITAAVAELRRALADVEEASKSDHLGARAADAASAARAEAEAVIDHAFVRALQLAAAIAALVLILRLARPRRPQA